jgi:hypothetical protein
MSKKSSRNRKKITSDPKTLVERVNPTVAMWVGILTLVVGAGTFMHTRWRDSEQVKIETGRHVVETVTDLMEEDSAVVAPIADRLARLGDTATARALVATIEAKQRTNYRQSPVILPEHQDSARAVLARAEEKVQTQRLPSGLVASSALADSQASLQIEIVPIPRDSSKVTLPSGEVVHRAHMGGLYEDAYGRLSCGGECRDSQTCCRIRVTPSPF